MKEAIFVGTSLQDLAALPEELQDVLGYALHLVQMGETPSQAKPLASIGRGV